VNKYCKGKVWKACGKQKINKFYENKKCYDEIDLELVTL
jgi:hypothetical protein